MTTRIYACIHILNSYNIRSFYNKNKAFQKLLLCTNLCARVFCSAQKGGICDAQQQITYMGLCHAQQTEFRHNCCNPDPANCRGPQKKSTLSCPVVSSPFHPHAKERPVLHSWTHVQLGADMYDESETEDT